MHLTNAEKLILALLAELHRKLDVQGDIDIKLLSRAIESDNAWALSWEMPGIVGDSPDPTPPLVDEVVNILGMWDLLERAYLSFDESTRARIKKEADPFGSTVRFDGFDGNNETEHLSVARFLINDMDRFSDFSGRELNSHAPSLEGYQRMLNVFSPLRNAGLTAGISPEHVIDILKARRHP